MRPVIFLFACAIVSNGQTPISVDICDLLANLSAWNGKVVSVDASLKSAVGLEGEPDLSGEHCKVHINVGGLDFPTSLC